MNNQSVCWGFKVLLCLSLCACSGKSDNTFSNLLAGGDVGTGTASIAINSYLPATASVVIKKEDTKTFIVSAVGSGTLRYSWTLDNVAVGGNTASYTVDATAITVGNKVLKVTINDDIGTVSQSWNVKINGTPVINSATPSLSTLGIRRLSDLSLSVSASDPNSDTLTYTWKVDGSTSVITSTTNSATYTPPALSIGTHTVSVDVLDGPVSDAGTYTVTQSWTVKVNSFEDGCNNMANNSSTNRACVYTGISSIGDSIDPSTYPTLVYTKPTSVFIDSYGNPFITDNYNNVVSYWNRTNASVTVVGITVPANTLKVVAGVGVGGSPGYTSSTLAVRTTLNSPSGLYYDGTNLFISDSSNNLVREVDSSNVITTVLGGGSSQTDGVAATTHKCYAPYGVVRDGNDLFVACGSEQRVKRVDLTTGLAYTFAGTGATSTPTSGNEVDPVSGGANSTVYTPYGLAFDSSKNLYISEYSSCRVRVVNRTGSTISFYGSLTVSSGKMRTILGNATGNTCSMTEGAAPGTARVQNPRNIFLVNNALFVANNGNHSITAVNLSASTQTYGSVSVASYNMNRIIGNGSGGYLGEGSQASATRFYTPYDISYDSTRNEYLVADYSNYRLRGVKSDFTTELLMGNGNSRYGSAGNGSVEATAEKLSNPRHLAYDTVNHALFITDQTNHRIRMVDQYGQVTTALGTGAVGLGAEEQEYPTNITMNQPRGIALVGATASFGGHIIFSDSQNHRIRFWNRSNASVTYFGVTIGAGLVASVAGTGSSGNGTSGSALSAALNNPEGVASNGTNLYIADTNNHCIKMVDSSGNISVAAGTCGSAGNTNGAAGTGRLNSPAGISYYKNGTNEGIFIADRGNSRIRFMRIAGTNAIAGVPVAVGDTNTVACGSTYHDDNIIAINSSCNQTYGVTVVGNKFCFSNYNYHNVRCVDISTGMITTALGPTQGSSTTPSYFPLTSLGPNDQNNTIASFGSVPSLTDTFGATAFPMGLASDGTSELYVAEYGPNLIRKVILP